jgi:hypothetical protein
MLNPGAQPLEREKTRNRHASRRDYGAASSLSRRLILAISATHCWRSRCSNSMIWS